MNRSGHSLITLPWTVGITVGGFVVLGVVAFTSVSNNFKSKINLGNSVKNIKFNLNCKWAGPYVHLKFNLCYPIGWLVSDIMTGYKFTNFCWVKKNRENEKSCFLIYRIENAFGNFVVSNKSCDKNSLIRMADGCIPISSNLMLIQLLHWLACIDIQTTML